ncbi:ABC transporter substrate-binding protein [Bailinhaonella thermotolerans]|uniref:Extracellular solute-binding protein n=1 Tax=Bailinhaonella thermotolerans TaxID=1070861 RepID=A0A3A4BFH2_9ACTN|nr:extracellular solute-binding protein [Bailinhaonella thermotolerans]RJL30092.1 extracellular solute-binding protein [Bailinhaonella thermotolerans]
MRGPKIVAAGVMAALALAACGGSPSENGSAEGGGKGEFTYWSMWRADEPQAKVIKAAIDRFQAETGTKVKVEWQGRDIKVKIGPAIAAGKAPDLWDNAADVVSTTVVTGQAADLSSVFDSQVPGEGKKVSELIDTKLVDTLPKDPSGSTKWLVPYELISTGWFYNAADKDLAEQPKTWDELIKLCDALKAKDKPCLASDGELMWENFLTLDLLLVRDNGAGTLAKIFEDKSGAGWDAPGVLESAKRMEQLVKGGYLIKGYDASKYPAQQTNWAQGKAAFLSNGSWVAAEVSTLVGPDWKMGALQIPPTKGGNTEVNVSLIGFSVPKKAENPEPAKRFISYFIKKDNLEKIATEAKNITPRADIPAPAELADVQKQLSSNPVRPVLDNLPREYNQKVLFPAFLEMWHGKISAQEFVAKAKEAHVQYWKTAG